MTRARAITSFDSAAGCPKTCRGWRKRHQNPRFASVLDDRSARWQVLRGRRPAGRQRKGLPFGNQVFRRIARIAAGFPREEGELGGG